MGSDTESSKHLLRQSDVSDENLKFDVNPTTSVMESDSEHVKHSKTNSSMENVNFEQAISATESEPGSSKTYMTCHELTTCESDRIASVKKSGSFSSSSSCSSLDYLFDENFFRIDEKDHSRSHTNTSSLPIIDEDDSLFSRDSERIGPYNTSPISRASELGSPGSASLISLNSEALMLSPPTQLMERSDKGDSYRIPASVFERSKSVAPVEWSVASNESLFSIHLGNSSFRMGKSGELMFSQELNKSGELIFPPYSGELDKSAELIFPKNNTELDESEELTFPKVPEFSEELGKTGELIFPRTSAARLISNSPSSPNAVRDPPRKSCSLGEGFAFDEAVAQTMKEVLMAAAEEKKQSAKGIHKPSSVSHHSDVSGASISSFAFEIRKTSASNRGRSRSHSKCSKWLFCGCCCCCCCNCCQGCGHCCRAFFKCEWPSCFCSSCSWTCCQCTWPSCFCPCSDCSCPCSHCSCSLCWCSECVWAFFKCSKGCRAHCYSS